MNDYLDQLPPVSETETQSLFQMNQDDRRGCWLMVLLVLVGIIFAAGVSSLIAGLCLSL